jgi:GNAT superfamily N-acetyltransferase
MKDVIENPVVHFSIHVACENDEPDRVMPAIHGDIFLYGEDGSPETKIGYIEALWVQAGRALNEGESLLEAMDSVSNECEECFCALLEHETEDWKPEVVELYGEEPEYSDILFIERLELEPQFRGKGIGARVVDVTVKTFAQSCGLVACKPFPLQHMGNEKASSGPDLAKVRNFWTGCGFRNVPGSDIFTFAVWLKEQPQQERIQ